MKGTHHPFIDPYSITRVCWWIRQIQSLFCDYSGFYFSFRNCTHLLHQNMIMHSYKTLCFIDNVEYMQGIKLEFIGIYLVQSLQLNKWKYLPLPNQCRIKASELVVWSLTVLFASMSLLLLPLFYASIKTSLFNFSNQVEIIIHCLPLSVWFSLISLNMDEFIGYCAITMEK